MVALDGNHGRRKERLMGFRRIGDVLAGLMASPEKLQASAYDSAQADKGDGRLDHPGEEQESRPPTRGEVRAYAKGKGRSANAPASFVQGWQNVGLEEPPTLSDAAGKCESMAFRRNTGSPCPAMLSHLTV